jgi:hypothetical protein
MFSGKNIIEITKELASEDPHPHLKNTVLHGACSVSTVKTGCMDLARVV